MARSPTLRIGHRGADALIPGNTLESFAEAVRIGVDVIELDVVWTAPGAEVMVAHDLADLAAREHPSLTEVLDAFTRPPLDAVEIDIDLKLAGREAEIVAAVRAAGLAERTMFSGMEPASFTALAVHAPDLRGGWTLPRISGDPRRSPLLRPLVKPGLALLAWRLPGLIERRAEAMGVSSVWVLHQLVTARLAEAAHRAGLDLIAWTVDSAARQRELVELGVDGLVSNDPRLFDESLGPGG